MRWGLLDPHPRGYRAGLVVDGRLWAYAEASPHEDEVTDRLFYARVVRVEPRLAAAFLDIGGGRIAFLTARDARFLDPARSRRRIQELVREGQRLVVQGLREGDDDKGPRVTADVRLFGLFTILRPRGGESTISGRARGQLKQRLRTRAARLFPDGRVVLRRFADAVDDQALVAEVRRLEARWRAIEAGLARGRPGPVEGGEDAFARLLRWLLEGDIETLRAGDAAVLARLERELQALPPAVRPRLERVRGPLAFLATGMEEQFEQALEPVVPLEGGGRLVIEETTALVAIDVDGEGRDALELDLAAAREIARQVRLRNLGGNIVVDFVDLPRPSARKLLDDALKKGFRDDPAQAQVHPMSVLGLVHITRARRGQPLSARYRRHCSTCGGSGRVPSPEARLLALYQALRASARPVVAVRVGPQLAEHLRALADLSWLGGTVWRRDEALAADEFVVETA